MIMRALCGVVLSATWAFAQDAPPPADPPLTPAQARVARQLGENLFREGKFEAALREWKRVQQVDRTDPVVWYFVGACQAQLRRHGEAIVAFGRALEFRPGWESALSARAGCALLQGDYAAAKRDYESAIGVARGNGKAPNPSDVQLLEQAQECAAGAARAPVDKPAPPLRCHDAANKSTAWAELLPTGAERPAAVMLVFHGGMRSPQDVAQLARLREHAARIAATGTRLYCISRDPPLENRILAEEKGLEFPMLSDTDGATAKAFGMVDLRRPGVDPGTLLGVAIVDREGILRYRAIWLDPTADLDCKALAVVAGKITGTPPPTDDDEEAPKETPR